MGKILGQKTVQKSLEVAVEKNLPALLIGETGCGKTSLIRELGKKKKVKVLRFNMTGETTVDDFLGTRKLENGETPWVDGVLLQAMRNGHWLVVDEINMALPEVLAVLQSLLDDDRQVTLPGKEGEVVKCHPDFRFFATMNPTDEYAGTKELNKALKSRFPIIEHVEYPDAKTEAKVLVQNGLELETASKLVDVALRIRRQKQEGTVYYTCSTRDLIQWAELIEVLGMQKAFEVAIMNKSEGDKEMLQSQYTNVMGDWERYERSADRLTIEEIMQAKQELENQRFNNERERRRLANWAEELANEKKVTLEEAKKQVMEEVRLAWTRAGSFLESAV